MCQNTPMVFVFMRKGSPHIQVVHYITLFAGNPFMKANYHEKKIFYKDSVSRSELNGIVITDAMWAWKIIDIIMDTITVTSSYGDV